MAPYIQTTNSVITQTPKASFFEYFWKPHIDYSGVSTDNTAAIEEILNNQIKAVDGKFIYKKTDEETKMKEIEFKNTYIAHYKETGRKYQEQKQT